MYVTKTPTEHEASRVGLISESTRKLDDVVARNLPMFYRRAFRYLGSMPDAEDAVQDFGIRVQALGAVQGASANVDVVECDCHQRRADATAPATR